MQAFYTAKQGISAHQRNVDIIANNIANIGTCSFKSARTDFKDMLYSQMHNAADPQSNANLKCGTGALTGATTRSFVKGTPKETGVSTDFYIDGDGFFAVQGNDGTAYTRNGCFTISEEEDGSYLVTSQGRYVLDDDNQRIRITGSVEDLTVNADGELSSGGTVFAKLQLVTFVNKDGLYSADNCTYIASQSSGDIVASQATVKQGFSEESNVDLSLELTKLIRAQRAFSVTAQALVMADQMDAAANNIRA